MTDRRPACGTAKSSNDKFVFSVHLINGHALDSKFLSRVSFKFFQFRSFWFRLATSRQVGFSVTGNAKIPVNGMVRRRTLEVVECGVGGIP